MADPCGMVDNDDAIAEMLYSAWVGMEDEPEWSALPQPMKWRWLRVARQTQSREVDLCAKLARDSYRKRFEARLLERLARWDAGK
jgi:hypothetical protein